MYAHCRSAFPDERKPSDTEEQFIYKARKKALGTFKRELWDLPEEMRGAIRASLGQQFAFLYRQLKVDNTREMVARKVSVPGWNRSGPNALRVKAAADDWDLSD
jgi:hypothetical protein